MTHTRGPERGGGARAEAGSPVCRGSRYGAETD